VLTTILTVGDLSAEEDGDKSRHPYTYKYNVVDEDTKNNYEVEEFGNPDIVRGSYRIALPDGRTQVVTYEVHPSKGYNAKVTYEGTAQYPDNPGYFASPYGPPEPINPQGNDKKFKRQSRQFKNQVVASDDLLDTIEAAPAVRGARKVELSFKEKESKHDLISASSQTIFSSNPSKTKNVKAIRKPERGSEDKDDTKHAPQAEPLSLQQSPSIPRRRKTTAEPGNKASRNKHRVQAVQVETKSTKGIRELHTHADTDSLLDDTKDSPLAETIIPKPRKHTEKPAPAPPTQLNSQEIKSVSPQNTPLHLEQELQETTENPEVAKDKGTEDHTNAATIDTSNSTIGQTITAKPVTEETVTTVDQGNKSKKTDITEDLLLADSEDVLETGNNLQSLLLDNIFYETKFIEENLRPFRAVARNPPVEQRIVNPYEYKLDSNFFSVASQSGQTIKNTENVIEENGKKSAELLPDLTDDILAENNIDSDYYEDYYSFPFGSRIPSVIQHRDNTETEDRDNTQTKHRDNTQTRDRKPTRDRIPTRSETLKENRIKASTIKPRGIIQKIRKPVDQSESGISIYPVPRGDRLTFVEMKEGSFVPQYYTI